VRPVDSAFIGAKTGPYRSSEKSMKACAGEGVFTAGTAAAVLGIGLFYNVAFAFSAPAAQALTAPRVIEPVVNVCGTNGCAPVQTKKVIHHRKPGNTKPGNTLPNHI
jgi:hypothetical protein